MAFEFNADDITAPTMNVVKGISKDLDAFSEGIQKIADKIPKGVLEDLVNQVEKYRDALKQSGKTDQSVIDATKKLAGTFQKFSTGEAAKALGQLNVSLGSLEGRLKSFGGGRGKAPGAMEGSFTSKALVKNAGVDGTQYGHEFGHAVNTALAMTAGKVMTGFLGGASAYQLIAKDMIEQEYEFAMGMNQIAFQTKSIAQDAPGMQKAFRETSDIAATTGFDLTTYQQALLHATKRALMDSQSITKTGLNLGKMMGLNEQEAADIADQFADWNQHLGMDKLVLADVSRGIQDVSRYTGLTGQNLTGVVKATEKFLDRMRAAGTLTAQSAKNFMLMGAEAKKLGIGDEMSDVMGALTSGADLLFKASDQTKNILFQAAHAGGVMKELMDGTITNSQAGLKKLAGGYKQVFKNISGGIDIKDIDKLSADQKSKLNLRVEAAFGKGLDDFRREMTVLDKSGMSFSERLADIDKGLSKNATLEEKNLAIKQKQQVLMSKSFEFSTSLAEAAKNADTFEDAIDGIQKKMGPQAWGETKKDLADVAGTFSKDLKFKVLSGDKTSIASAMMLSAGEALKKANGKDFTNRISKAIKNKDMVGLQKIQEDMNVEQQKLGVETITKLDPMADAALQLKQINENLRSYTGPAIVALTTLVGSTGLIAGMMAAGALGGAFKIEAIKAWLDALKIGLDKVMGKATQKVEEKALDVAAKGAWGKGSTALNQIGGAAMRGEPAVEAGGAWGKGAAALNQIGGAAVRGEPAVEAAAAVPAVEAAGAGLMTMAVYAEVFLGVVGGIVGYINAGNAAAKIFNTSVEELTMSQLYAAKGAGAITGALNFMTFGIFNKWLNATGSVTVMLAKFNELFPLFSAIAAVVDICAGVIWGFIKGIWNIIKGIGSMIAIALKPLMDSFSAIGEFLTTLLSPLTEFGSSIAKTGSLFSIVSNAIASVGTAIGWVLEIIGGIIAFIFKILLTPMMLIVKFLTSLVKKIYGMISEIFEPLYKAFSELWDAFGSLFTPITELAAAFGTDGEFSWLSVLSKAAEALATVIGGLIRGALWPVQRVIGIITAGLQIFTSALKAVADKIKSIVDYIKSWIPNWMLKDDKSAETADKTAKAAEAAAAAAKKANESGNTTVKPPVVNGGAYRGGAYTAPRLGGGTPTSLVEAGLTKGGPEFVEMNAARLASLNAFNAKNGSKGLGGPTNVSDLELQQAMNIPAAIRPGGVVPLPLTDVHAQIQREQATTVAAGQRSNTGTMAQLVTINEDQLEYLIMIHDDLQNLNGLMTPSGRSQSQAIESTRSKTSPADSPNYHKWQYGRYQGNASVNVISDGR